MPSLKLHFKKKKKKIIIEFQVIILIVFFFEKKIHSSLFDSQEGGSFNTLLANAYSMRTELGAMYMIQITGTQ